MLSRSPIVPFWCSHFFHSFFVHVAYGAHIKFYTYSIEHAVVTIPRFTHHACYVRIFVILVRYNRAMHTRGWKKISGAIFFLLCLVGMYHVYKPLPENLDISSTLYTVPSTSVHFFTDRTSVDTRGERQSKQEIFDEVFRMIRDADSYVLVDMFLFNNFLGTATTSYRHISEELVQTLIDKKETSPNITIQVITDPLNTLYGGYDSPELKRLTDAGIPVTLTALTELRDSNPLYSALWRTFLRWVPVHLAGPILPNLLDAKAGDVGLETYLTMLNFKANHRKIILADYLRSDGSRGMSTLVTSANPHTGSSAHTNTALRIDEHIWQDAVSSEESVALFSKSHFVPPSSITDRVPTTEEATLSVRLLTEQSIKRHIIAELESLSAGDSFDMAMFYLSDRDVIRALKDADTRGISIRIILDPNKDAFGRQKGGVPNRQVAHELMSHSQGNTQVRWCDTHGEQCHTKLLIYKRAGTHTIVQGSANLTRRNLNNLNLETDVLVQGLSTDKLFVDIQSYFDTSWNNDGVSYTLGYEAYADTRLSKKLLYRFGELTGMSSY